MVKKGENCMNILATQEQTHVFLCIHIHVCVCVRRNVYVCVRVCVCVCVRV